MDTIANMLISIKNGGNAGKRSVSLPYSKMNHAIADCLQKHGYISNVSKKTEKEDKDTLQIDLNYEETSPKVTHVERISKPSRRMYIKSKDIRPIRNGFGLMILSTPKGILEGMEAKKQLVGGEMLFKIW